MGSKFKGFERCFKMTINTTDTISLEALRCINDDRKELEVKIIKGTVTRFDMMKQLRVELAILDNLLKTSTNKMTANLCCKTINSVISILTKRINNMWNTIFLLFVIKDEIEPEFINVTSDYKIVSNCQNCSNCNTIYKSITSNIKIISTQEDKLFNFSSSDFMKILQTTVFVDKTLMIKELFELFENKLIRGTVATAPRKYGKTTNLTMLKYFLEIQVDSLGNVLTKANAWDPVTDTSNYKLFEGLKISKEVSIMDKHFGKYPVAYLNFKIEKSIKSYDCFIQGYKEVIHTSFQSHNYLIKSSKLSLVERTLCMLWCNTASYKKLKNIDEIRTGFSSLCAYLTKHYRKQCFVLIDDIDFLIMSDSISQTKDFCSILFFMKHCLSFLTDGQLVYKSFMTGKYGYPFNRIVPSSVQLKLFSMFHEFTDYYGLTINELEYLFKKNEFKALTVTIDEVKAYYGSYDKYEVPTKNKKQIYCIWSILNVLKCKTLENYWREFGKIFCNFSKPSVKNKMQQLLNNEKLYLTIYDTTVSRTYPVPPPTIAASETSFQSLNFFYNTLLDLGYLTSITASIATRYIEHLDRGLAIKIPNEEVRQDIKHKLSLLT